MVHDREAQDGAAPRKRGPGVRPPVAVGTEVLRRPAKAPAAYTALRPQLAVTAGIPERPRVDVGQRDRLRMLVHYLSPSAGACHCRRLHRTAGRSPAPAPGGT